MNPIFLMPLSCLLLFLLPRLSAQQCFHFGSFPVPAQLEASPWTLPCANWPQWHLLTPAHDAPAPHFGFAPGDASARPRLLVRYRCTGFLLLPVLPDHVRTSGYVIHQPEFPCQPLRP
jgi:hypothetical protein